MSSVPERPSLPPVTGWDRLGVVLVTLSSALAALFQVLLVPLYVGASLLPITVLLALVSNIVLPWMAYTLVPRTLAALAPFGAWMVVVLGFGSIARPEGDVILPAAPRSVELVTYAVLLGGALAGTATVVWLTQPTRRQPKR